MKKRPMLTTNITRLPRVDWELPREPERTVVQPWDFDTPIDADAVWEGDTILLGEHRDASLDEALDNTTSWGIIEPKQKK